MSKIIKFDELNELKKKTKNKKIVLAHGTFDFFHHGHLQHLKKSKSIADILIVSITSDRYIKKGPNRPLYNQKKRAILLSHLDFVDYVVVVDNPTAIEIINELKPNFYSKGIEYKNHDNDYTNAISLEFKALKKNKGKIVYTNEKVMSSSNIINSIFDEENNELKKFKENFRFKNKFKEYFEIFEKFKNKKILVIGDVILDEYIKTIALAKSPKEELISVKEEKKTIYYGGILATAKHLSSFSNNVKIISVLGKKSNKNKMIINHIRKYCKFKYFTSKDRDNNIKTRYLDTSNKKLFQSNIVNFNYIDKSLEKKILDFLTKNIKSYDVVLINDFGHGLMTQNIRNFLEKNSKKLCLNVQTNSSNFGFNYFNKYNKCDYLTLDEPEARLGTFERFGDTNKIAKKILKEVKTNIVSITYGANGTRSFNSKRLIKYVPAFTNKAIDTLGAGDAFFAISSLFFSENKDPEKIAFVGNVAGALKVQYLAHQKHITKKSFYSFLKSILA
ncbi:PfkB family carbohydrate kinase [Candidatus Pelagibacter communis]|uniref:Cytidylyltransferase/carbohydrate (Or pyrimidine) kinase n=2 Tax=Pelagibacter ubique TaxID=198252 RepID=Q4FN79_PELUB|nr:PfkB family carbohydrate kinase [Candidatus Pelagibacter ubique]AAZ21360.1 cytidylyltransferase/carbohydrate (or pyrimidine) kinase [Candidatus Pelagibacter ubique HTCC1062]EAS84778.1 cytidylyltransferase/carbohydrate (or pyrimidine) kinase [Candidatus Pelagibacter ubique HTCC1002]